MNFNVKYYDHPEGTDAFGKMFVTNKYALIAGLGWGTVDCLFLSKPQGYLQTLSRYAFFTGPFMGMASAFTMATYTATKVRGKDDYFNYVIGALSSGAVFGALRRSVLAGCLAGGAFSIAACVKRNSIENQWDFIPPFNSHIQGSFRGVRHDWTLMAERPRNWTTGKDKD